MPTRLTIFKKLKAGAAGRFYRSDGVAVTGAVKRLIAAGDAARDTRRWYEAAETYGRALSRAPELTHIWLQKGHALKELGDFAAASAAYLQADRLTTGQAETALHLGHVAKIAGDMQMAGRHYLEAFRRDPTHPEAFSELHHLLARGPQQLQKEVASTLREQFGSPPSIAETQHFNPQAADARPIIFDVSDLIAYFSHARLPTGIQRVQLETIRSALLNRPLGSFGICCVLDGRDEWLEVPQQVFLDVINKSVKSGDRGEHAWLLALNRLYLDLRAADTFIFPTGACLVNLGTSWWIDNYFLHVRYAKAAHSINYIPLIYDLIPVVSPQFCVPELTRSFSSWLEGVFFHADLFLSISKATRDDLLRVSRQRGQPLQPAQIIVTPLDVDFSAGEHVMNVIERDAIGIKTKNFVLFVSTIEARKGHLLAFETWRTLLLDHGADQVPMLVCVGRNGWLNDTIYHALRDDKLLASRVTIISGLSDGELAALYETCLFTIYPSHYEGWGLPVTEAFCYGKAVLCSNSSSLPEAGGELACYFDIDNHEAFAALAERLIFDDAYRAACEARIRREFTARTWKDFADQVFREVTRWATAKSVPTPKEHEAALETAYSFARLSDLDRGKPRFSGEIFRAGLGWWWPGDEGCWTKPGGGALWLRLPQDACPFRCEIDLLGLPTQDTNWTIRQTGGAAEASGKIAAAVRKRAVLDIAVLPSDGILRLNIVGDTVEETLVEVGSGKAVRPIAIGLAEISILRLASVDRTGCDAGFRQLAHK